MDWRGQSVLILLVSVAFTSQPCVDGCHSAEDGREENDEFRRRKRQVQNSAETEVLGTVMLRDFFTNCLADQVGEIWSWNSVIDVTILDSMWFANSAETSCSSDGDEDDSDCWKSRLRELLREQSSLMGPSQDCIDLYVENTTAGAQQTPRSGRKKRSTIQGSIPARSVRAKRQATTTGSNVQCSTFFPNAPAVRRYGMCNQESVQLTPGREEVDFESVSQFIAEEVTCSPEFMSCDGGRMETLSQGDPGVPEWPYRFEAVTRPSSVVREAVVRCNDDVFPISSEGCQEWSTWSTCVCGPGNTRTRSRLCLPNSVGESQQTRSCDGEERCVPSFIDVLRQILIIRSQLGFFG